MNNFEEIINKTQSVNEAIADYSRIIVETDEKNPKVIAVITNHDFEIANGYRIRLKPIYEENNQADQVIENSDLNKEKLKRFLDAMEKALTE